VPSKSLIASAAQQTRDLGSLGLSGHLDPVDLGTVMDRVRCVIQSVYQGEDAGAWACGRWRTPYHVYPTLAMAVRQAALGFYTQWPA